MPILRTRVDRSGRIVIPAEVRRRLGVGPGDEVVLDVGPDDVQLSSHSDALAMLKRMVREATASKRHPVEGFLAEQRGTSAGEDLIWLRRRRSSS